jgi:hypothetical protein
MRFETGERIVFDPSVRRDSGGQAGQTIVMLRHNRVLAALGGRPLRGAFGHRRLGEGARVFRNLTEDPRLFHGNLDDRRHQDQEDDGDDDQGQSVHDCIHFDRDRGCMRRAVPFCESRPMHAARRVKFSTSSPNPDMRVFRDLASICGYDVRVHRHDDFA